MPTGQMYLPPVDLTYSSRAAAIFSGLSMVRIEARAMASATVTSALCVMEEFTCAVTCQE